MVIRNRIRRQPEPSPQQASHNDDVWHTQTTLNHKKRRSDGTIVRTPKVTTKLPESPILSKEEWWLTRKKSLPSVYQDVQMRAMTRPPEKTSQPLSEKKRTPSIFPFLQNCSHHGERQVTILNWRYIIISPSR
jgi:hypothetical protein